MTTCVYTEPFGWVPHHPEDGDDIVVIRCAAHAKCKTVGTVYLDNATLFLPPDYTVVRAVYSAGHSAIREGVGGTVVDSRATSVFTGTKFDIPVRRAAGETG